MTAAYVSAMIGMRNGAGVATHPKAVRRKIREATADFPDQRKCRETVGSENAAQVRTAEVT